MPRRPERDEDLFKDSTMSFGEHLEELRKSLFRAVLWLIGGVLIGLLVANRVVSFVQTPLEAALTRYFQADSKKVAGRKIQEMRTQLRQRLIESGYDGESADQKIKEMQKRGDFFADEEYVQARVAEGLLPEMIMVDRDHFLKALGIPSAAASPSAVAPPVDGEASKTSKANLVSVFTFHAAVDDSRIHARTLGAGEAFTIWLKAALLVGAILACPMVFYELWMFVAAGLYPHEKRYIHIYLPFSVGLFLSGAALAFLFALQPVLDFLLDFNQWMGITPDLRISEWLSFVLLLPLGFGISFQLPLVMLFLERIGVFTVRSYVSRWRVSVLVIFVLSMVCTPGDPYSMLLMACTLTVLYFGGILLCRLMPKRKSEFEDLDVNVEEQF